jgi:hypothetical protein
MDEKPYLGNISPVGGRACRSANTACLALLVLRSYFGKGWPLFAVLLLAVVFWPPFVFRSRIVFAPEHFVEEWLKLGVGGVLLFFLLEIGRARSTEQRAVEKCRRTIHERYVPALKFVLQNLTAFVATTKQQDLRTATTHIDKANLSWHSFEELTQMVTWDLDSCPEVRSNIAKILDSLDGPSCRQTLKELAAVNTGPIANEDACEKLLVRLGSAIQELESV